MPKQQWQDATLKFSDEASSYLSTYLKPFPQANAVSYSRNAFEVYQLEERKKKKEFAIFFNSLIDRISAQHQARIASLSDYEDVVKQSIRICHLSDPLFLDRVMKHVQDKCTEQTLNKKR